MTKIRIKNEIIELANCFSISVLQDEIHFEKSGDSGDWMRYRRGIELTSAEFDTLSAWITNVTNNPYTTVI